MRNIAFIDGQNLHMGTKTCPIPWRVDFSRFMIYLQKKYDVEEAYYFFGYKKYQNHKLYAEIKRAGFILIFKKHNSAMLGQKKGNVDTDIVFHIMKKLYKKEEFDQIILVSSDGDYKLLIDFLIKENKFKKILFPNRNRASSLYKTLSGKYFVNLNDTDIKKKISK